MPDNKKPIIKDGFLISHKTPIQVGSELWFEWLATATKFSFKYQNGSFMAQCEQRRNNVYWYAYKRLNGKLHKAYLGKTEEVTLEKLQQIGDSLTGPAHFEHPRPVSTSDEPSILKSRIDSSFLPITKITVPVLPRQLVTRRRLNQKIDTPLTLIYAPSGFGKSTLLNDWKQTCGFPVAWLALDERDNNLVRFLYSVITSFQIIHKDFGKELLSYISSAPNAQPAEVVHHLTNGIIEAQNAYPVLGIVLDDFHRINQAAIYDTLQFWLEHFPSNLQLVISGHTRPPLSLGHLRARGLLTELDVNDLRFTTAEGVNYLQQYHQAPPLAYDDLEKLVKHTEGWAAGLTLTALALGKQGDQRQFIDTFSGAHIYMREYFMETVLQRSSPELQSFLLKTSLLKNLNGSLCNAITGRSDGEKMLEHLWQENLFIIRLERQGWYKYHDLFAEMLSNQLQTRFADEIPELHQRAANWYREQYAPADAIYHLLSTEAWEEAATLIEEMALRELEQFGEDSRLLRWLQDLPEGVVQKHKNLLFVYMRLANNAMSQKKIEKFITYIEKSISVKPAVLQTQEEKDVLIEIQEIRHTWAQGGTFIPPARIGSEYEVRWELLNRIYLLKPAYSQHESFPDEPLTRMLEEAQAQHNLFVILMTGGVLAKRFMLMGQLGRAEKVCRQILDGALSQRGQLPETASIALGVLSQLSIERNEIDLAQRYLAQAAEVDPNPTSTNMPIQITILRARIQIILNQPEKALASVQAARSLNLRRPAGTWTSEHLLAYEALTCLRIGDLPAAEQLLKDGVLSVGNHLLQQVQAEIFLKKGQFQEAEELLQEMLHQFSSIIIFEPVMELRILLSLALFRQNKVNQSVQVMADAVRQAAPERFARPFLDWGEACLPIFSLVLEMPNLNHEAQKFLTKTLKIIISSTKYPRLSSDEMERLTTSASISARELEVLQLLSEGHSNIEISQYLSVSQSTIKTHLGNIYTKLKVNSRMLAVSKAKQLKLIP